MDDDLNTPDALAAIFELVKEINTQGKEASEAALTKAAEVFDELTGVLGLLYNRKTNEVPAEVMELVERRAAAKKAKDWGTADALRAQITEMGWQVEDTAQGPKVTSNFPHLLTDSTVDGVRYGFRYAPDFPQRYTQTAFLADSTVGGVRHGFRYAPGLPRRGTSAPI